MTRPKSPPCRCGEAHWRGLHHGGHCWAEVVYGPDGPDDVTFLCTCTRYRPAKGPQRGTKRSIYRESKSAERRVADEMGWERVGNRGGKNFDVVLRDEDRRVIQGGEVKHNPWKAPFNAYDQVKSVPTSGVYRRLVFLVEKPGVGRPSRILVCEEIGDWLGWNGKAALLERLEGE